MAGPEDPLDMTARLLLHLSGELSTEESAAMESLLSTDAAARAKLAELELLHGRLSAMVAAEPAVASPVSVQRAMRAMRQRRLELAARPMLGAKPHVGSGRRVVLQYASVALAASVALFIGLWGLGVFDGPVTPEAVELVSDQGYCGVDPNIVVRDDGSKRLEEAAEQLRALRAHEDEDRLLLML